MRYDTLRVAACTPRVFLANPSKNAAEHLRLAKKAAAQGAQVLVFPELSLTGATCADLFLSSLLLTSVEKELFALAKKTRSLSALLVVGFPLALEGGVCSAAAVLYEGSILGIVFNPAKKLAEQTTEVIAERITRRAAGSAGGGVISDDSENVAARTVRKKGEKEPSFVVLKTEEIPLGSSLVFESPFNKKTMFRVVIGDQESFEHSLALMPLRRARDQRNTVFLNPHATKALATQVTPEEKMYQYLGERALTVVRAGAGAGESTTDFVLNGAAACIEAGALVGAAQDKRLLVRDLHLGKRKDELPVFTTGVVRQNKRQPFLGKSKEATHRIAQEALGIQSAALMQRLRAAHTKRVVVGVSGGLDSTLALLVCADVFRKLKIDAKNIHAISMPGFGTTSATKSNARLLAEALQTNYTEVSIESALRQHFKDISHNMRIKNAAYENAQARERTQILMDTANDEDALVVGTGDLSEAALGWTTFNGDHMSMYNVNAGVPKTLVRAIVSFAAVRAATEEKQKGAVKRNEDTRDARKKNVRKEKKHEEGTATLSRVLEAILATPISPELLPPTTAGTIKQKTEDVLGPYELHDFFLYHVIKNHETPHHIVRQAARAFPDLSRPFIVKTARIFYKRFFSQQFKRSCSVDGPQVTDVSLSPRAGWQMPSDVNPALWLEDVHF